MSTTALIVFAVGFGGWTDQNLPIADATGEQAQPKIVATPDGGAYVSWLDNTAGGYDVYLQRLDADGNETWAHNGVLVADRGFSSTQNYGLSIDATGHALLAFRDDRFVGVQITANRIAPDGTLVWGVNGVQLTSDTAFHASPGIAGTTDGGIVVGWTNDVDVKIQRLDAAGTPEWGAGVTMSDGDGGEYLFSDMHGADAGQVIVSWNRQPGFLGNKHIYTQKLDVAGAARWNAGSPVIVFDGGSLQIGNFPRFVPDGSGGAVFGWYSSSPSLQCYAQHILADGTEAFPHNGSVGSTNASRLRVSPDVAYDAGTDSVLLFWTETNLAQSQHGVYGQRFDAAGVRQWTNDGREVVPVGAGERTFVNTTAIDGGGIVSFLEGTFGAKDVRAARLDADADFVWKPSIVTVSNATSGKLRLDMINDAGGTPLLVWQDQRNDVNDVYGQNLNADGSLGTPACDEDTNGDGVVDVTDLVAVILAWGTDDSDADVDDSGVVDVADLVAVVLAWGPC